MKKTLEQYVGEAVCEQILITPYEPEWINLFANEAEFLWSKLPKS